MRVVIADDSVLLREGIARLLEDGRLRRRRAGRQRRPAPAQGALVQARTSRSSTSGCRRRTPTRASSRRARSARRTRAPACSCSRSTSSPEYALDLLADSAEGVGYLLKDRVADVTSSPRRCGASARAARRSTRRSSRSSSAGGARDDPLADLTPARARGARADGRGPLEPGASRSARRHRARGREARDEHLHEAAPAGRRRTTTGACSPCSRTSATEVASTIARWPRRSSPGSHPAGARRRADARSTRSRSRRAAARAAWS